MMHEKSASAQQSSASSHARVCVELTLGFIILLQVGETSTDRVQLALSLFRVLARAEELWLGQVALGEFLAQV